MKPPPVDIICGGFPCQDISDAGLRAGIDGERSGLWREYARIVRLLRPGLVFVENVAALLGRGLDRVLGDLAACGYDAVWETFRAADVGAPHLRDRLFVLAYANGEAGRRAAWGALAGDGGEAVRAGEEEPRRCGGALADAQRKFVRDESGWLVAGRTGAAESGDDRSSLADSDSQRGDGWEREPGRRSPGRAPAAGNGAEGDSHDMADPMRGGQWPGKRNVRAGQPDVDGSCEDLAHTDSAGRQREVGRQPSGARRRHASVRGEQDVADANSDGRESERSSRILDGERTSRGHHADGCNCPRCYVHRFPAGPDQIAGWDGPQPAIRRSDDGVPGRSHRLRLLGNAVVPQQAALAFLTLLEVARGEMARAA